MADHRAFWHTGGPGGKHDIGRVRAGHVPHCFQRPIGVPCAYFGRMRVRRYPHHLAMLCLHPDVGEQQTWITLGEDALGASRWVARVEGKIGCTKLERGQNEHIRRRRFF